jgi:hypothetical protein
MDSDNEDDDLREYYSCEAQFRGTADDDETEADMLSQMISSQSQQVTQEDEFSQSQNVDALYAVIDAAEQKALLDMARYVDPITAQRNALWAERNELEPTFRIPIPNTEKYTNVGVLEEAVVCEGDWKEREVIERHAVVRKLIRAHGKSFKQTMASEQFLHVMPHGVSCDTSVDGSRGNFRTAKAVHHR